MQEMSSLRQCTQHMCQEKEARGQKRAKFAQHLAQEGLLPPLGDWINGLPGRYNQQSPSLPESAPQVWQSCGRKMG